MACEPHSDVVTGGVRVRVDAQLDNARSLPGCYAFVYHVCIVNEGAEPVQLVSRHWFISENDGSQTEVRPCHQRGETQASESFG
jgi:ApaG protein